MRTLLPTPSHRSLSRLPRRLRLWEHGPRCDFHLCFHHAWDIHLSLQLSLVDDRHGDCRRRIVLPRVRFIVDSASSTSSSAPASNSYRRAEGHHHFEGTNRTGCPSAPALPFDRRFRTPSTIRGAHSLLVDRAVFVLQASIRQLQSGPTTLHQFLRCFHYRQQGPETFSAYAV